MKPKQFWPQLLLIFGLLIPLFTLTACNQKAQVKDADAEFISTADLFSLKVPPDWSAVEVVPGADVAMANSEAALDRYLNHQAVQANDLVLNLVFLPLALFQENQLAHLGFQLEASPELFLQSLLPMFRLGDQPAAQTAGEATLISLANGQMAGRLTFSQENRAGLLLVFEVEDGVFAFVSALGSPETMPKLEDFTYTVAAEIKFQGTQQALYNALYGG